MTISQPASQTSPVYVVGVDGGGSSTKAVIMAADGQVVGRGLSGPSNFNNVGLAAAREALLAAIDEALQDASLSRSDLAAASWGIAGIDRPTQREPFVALAQDQFPDIPTHITNDAALALAGGTGSHFGVVLIAGTGSIAYGENGQGQHARSGGWGFSVDQGSGHALGMAALQVACRAADNDVEATPMVRQLLHELNLSQTTELATWLYSPDRSVAKIAALSPSILAAAEANDRLAIGIVSEGADALATQVENVARRLRLLDSVFPVVLCGSLLTENRFYRQLVTQAIRTRLPQVHPQLPQADAATGAGWLALEQLGYRLEPPESAASADSANTIWTSEQRNILSRNIDLLDTVDMVALMNLTDQQAVAAVRPLLPTIAKVIDEIAARMRQGGRLIYVGAGTSGRLGVLDASECPPTFSASPELVLGIIAGGSKALTSSIEAAEDDQNAGAGAISQHHISPLDTVVGIAASGRTPFVMGALRAASQQQALTVAISCNLPAPIADQADFLLAPLVGPEIITGSTRLKAGTAQKLLLNMLSTGVMIRLGKTFGNLMVDVQPSNQKLQARARRIVSQACDIDEATAEQALAVAGGAVKVAILIVLLGCDPEESKQRLAAAGGVIRGALDERSSL